MNYDFTKHLIYCEDKDRYKKIENIDKKFNFTNTIAYEFARRNENVNNTLALLSYLNFLYENLFKGKIERYQYLINSLNNSVKPKDFKRKSKLERILNKNAEFFYNLIYTGLTLYKKEDLKKKNVSINVKNMLKEIFEKLADELYFDYYVIYQLPTDYSEELKMLNSAIAEQNCKIGINLKNIKTKIKTENNFYSNDIYSPKKYIERDTTLSEMFNSLSDEDRGKIEMPNSNDSFIITQIKKGNKKEYYINTIYPKNDCPMRDFTDIKIAINLKLPEDELISYIREIKKEYNRDNSIIKTNMELLKDQLEITEDESENIRKSKGRQEKLSKDKRYNWADMFFIYDYYTQQREFNNKSFERIKEELLKIFSKKYGVDIIKNNKVDKNLTWEEYLEEYHPGESEDEVDFADVQGVRPVISERTIREKYEIMKNYINGKNPKYKILLNY